MLFTDVIFAPFLLLTFVAFACAARRPRAQRGVLLVASWVFYGWWDARFLALIAFSTVLDFVVGRRIHASENTGTRRAWLSVSLVGNLGLLAVFKYAGFFVESLRGALAGVGIEAALPHLDLVLPIGISFYTFQTLSYSLDIYYGRLEPTDSLLDFMLYVAAFPQLVAGPIVRARELLPQLHGNLFARSSSAGLVQIAYGLTKKVGLADPIGALFVDRVFEAHATASWPVLMLGVALYTFQIFLDFSAYTDIAIGLGRLFGLELPENFRRPFLAASPREFWERWHITLSTWLRDYLYLPLGGNRGGHARLYRNLMIVMLLGGLWHGAGWTYVIWGAIHGTALCAHRAWSQWRGTGPARGARRFASQWIWFAVLCVTFIVFRSADLASAWSYFEGIVTLRDGPGLGAGSIFALTPRLAILAAASVISHFFLEPRVRPAGERFARWPAIAQGSAVALFLVFLRWLDQLPGRGDAFIYFQF